MNRSILVIDDEAALVEALTEYFQSDYKVLSAGNGADGFTLALQEKPDIILLDINMPKENGLETCNRLRTHEETKHIPVLMLTAQGDLPSRLEAFSYGADDFIEKPFKMSELKARIASKIRRIEEQEQGPTVIQCGNLTVNTDKMEVLVNGKPIVFSTLEFNLLRFFLQNRDKVISREKLLAGVWQNTVVNDRAVDTHLVSIRKKLHDFDHEFATVYGAGYILRARS